MASEKLTDHDVMFKKYNHNDITPAQFVRYLFKSSLQPGEKCAYLVKLYYNKDLKWKEYEDKIKKITISNPELEELFIDIVSEEIC